MILVNSFGGVTNLNITPENLLSIINEIGNSTIEVRKYLQNSKN
jgi:hypothetical protein